MSVISWMEKKAMKKKKESQVRKLEEINKEYTQLVMAIGDLEAKMRINSVTLEGWYAKAQSLIEEGDESKKLEEPSKEPSNG